MSLFRFSVPVVVFYARYFIHKEGVDLAKEKVTIRMEEGELDLLKQKYNTNNQSEAIRLTISECLLNEDKGKIKILFPYISK